MVHGDKLSPSARERRNSMAAKLHKNFTETSPEHHRNFTETSQELDHYSHRRIIFPISQKPFEKS